MKNPGQILPIRSRPAQLPIYCNEKSNISVIIFVTVCTVNRIPILASPEHHKIIRAAWNQAANWIVGKYVIMPDHIHFFCAPATYPETNLQKWIQYWKALVRKAISESSGPIFQRNAWDRQLRNGDSYSEKWNYIRNNPVRKGLVANADDWPYQGEMNVLMWHE